MGTSIIGKILYLDLDDQEIHELKLPTKKDIANFEYISNSLIVTNRENIQKINLNTNDIETLYEIQKNNWTYTKLSIDKKFIGLFLISPSEKQPYKVIDIQSGKILDNKQENFFEFFEQKYSLTDSSIVDIYFK